MKGYEDLVKTLALIQSSHIMNCTPEAVCDYQDMIGTSTVEQIKELSNGVYKETFYKLYDVAYGTIATIKYYLNNSDNVMKILEEKADQEAEIEELKFFLSEQEKTTIEQKKQRIEAEKNAAELQKINEEQTAEIEALKAQMQELKAKLYDLMTA